MSTTGKRADILIRCPECGNPSDSIKCYRMIDWILFLVIYATWQQATYTCCPKCMRKHILLNGFTYNILTGNLLWIFLVLPWSIVQLIMSYTKGHSKKVHEMISPNE